MMSTRPQYCEQYDWRRANDRRMSVAQSPTLSEGFDTQSQLSRRTSPSLDIDNKIGAAPRKRVPVACDRCRKRKIKCSGNEGGNLGCSNCRNAGYQACQFLRVQSVPFGIAHNSPRSYQHNNRYHPYSVPNRSTYHHPQQNVYPTNIPYSHLQTSLDMQGYQTPAQNVSSTRTSYQVPYPMSYEDDSTSPYSAQPPLLMHPRHTDTVSNANTAFCFPQRSQAIWSETLGTVPTPNTHIVTPTYHMHASEIAGPYQPLSTVNASMAPMDRILPTPTASRGLGAAPFSSVESLSVSGLSQQSSKSRNTDSMSNASQVSSQTSYSNNQDSNQRTNTMCPAQDMPFGYIHEPQETIQTNTMVAGNERLQSSPEARVQTETVLVNPKHQRRTSNESLGSSPSSASYGHLSSMNRRSAQRPSFNHLVNGQTYAPVPKSRNGSLVSDSLLDSTSYQSLEAHRTSVASLSNASSY